MENSKNNRSFSRSNIAIATRLTPAGAASIDAMVVDLSMNGVLVKTDAVLEIGSKCHISMLIGHYMHELPISANGVVIRVQQGTIAICFDTIGIEAADELESMILFQSPDPEQCLNELEAIKIK